MLQLLLLKPDAIDITQQARRPSIDDDCVKPTGSELEDAKRKLERKERRASLESAITAVERVAGEDTSTSASSEKEHRASSESAVEVVDGVAEEGTSTSESSGNTEERSLRKN